MRMRASLPRSLAPPENAMLLRLRLNIIRWSEHRATWRACEAEPCGQGVARRSLGTRQIEEGVSFRL